MELEKTYDLFISHAWQFEENTEYYNLVDLLRNARNFNWRNFSVPDYNPFGTKSAKELELLLEKLIKDVDVVIVMMGMYYFSYKWVNFEVELAHSYSKPIIGISPRGLLKLPANLTGAVNTIVGWNTDAIVTAIKIYSAVESYSV